ncbi:hypothetical protein SLA2020_025600 [Shorea laevis]
MTENPFSVQIVRKEQPIYHGCKSILLELPKRADWWHEIYSALLQYKFDVPLKDLSNYIVIFTSYTIASLAKSWLGASAMRKLTAGLGRSMIVHVATITV